MRFGDYFIQRWRMSVAKPWVPKGSRILDVGCFQGEFLEYLGGNISPSVGIDPLIKKDSIGQHEIFQISLDKNSPFPEHSFDVVSLLAVIEHIENKAIVAKEAKRLLRSGGRVVITVPSPFVDVILEILIFLRLVDGMSLEEHHDFSPDELLEIFIAEGFSLLARKKFQMGLNNLFVFESN